MPISATKIPSGRSSRSNPTSTRTRAASRVRYLSRASDWFDLAEYGGAPDPATSVRNALAKMKLERALVIGVETDILFPLEQQQQLADDLSATGTDTTFVGLDSPQGHDAFLVDTGRFGAAIGAFMTSL